MYKEKSIDKIRNFTDLVAWQEGHKLVLMVYRETKKFPLEERYGLVSQMRSAAVSITSNIAEGFGRKSSKEKQHFYNTSKGSLNELQNQFLVSKDIEYLSEESFDKLIQQSIVVDKLLTGLLKSVRPKVL